LSEDTRRAPEAEEEGDERMGARRRYIRRPRFCQFCVDQVKAIDYKQADLVRRYVTEQGKIRGRRDTGSCAKHQRMVTRAIKRARHMAILPFRTERFR